MASIVKRKKKYSVVYTYTDENGNKRQKWETFDTNGEAKKRKLEVEYAQEAGTFIPPSAKTVNDLLEEYMSIYGVNTWAMSTYESRKSLISNYIRPLIGDMKLEDVTPRIMDKYYRDLLTVKAVSTKYVKARNEYLTPHTIREIHKVLRNAFNQAVKWELMTRNPVEHATLPKEEHKTRDIWTAEVLLKALESCDDDILRLAINLAFSCSLRMGELLGLTWDCVDISPASIELGQASIFVEKELQRVNREAMADLNGKDILFKFPPTFASTHTALVLKTPKTKTSVRKVFLPKTVAEMLVQRKADIEELKDLFGDEFTDFNLVFCSSNGKPIEGQVINRAFNKLIEENGLPKVVFHSLRHSSITYKDDVSKVEISKIDIAGEELPGAELSILDENGEVVESWTSTEEPHYIEMLPIGKYTLHEESAPEGYLVAEDVAFEVKDTGEIQRVVMKDEAEPEETPETPQDTISVDAPKTGDHTNILLWSALLGLGLCGSVTAVILRRKRK